MRNVYIYLAGIATDLFLQENISKEKAISKRKLEKNYNWEQNYRVFAHTLIKQTDIKLIKPNYYSHTNFSVNCKGEYMYQYFLYYNYCLLFIIIYLIYISLVCILYISILLFYLLLLIDKPILYFILYLRVDKAISN